MSTGGRIQATVSADGVRIAYTVTGEGPPLLECLDPLFSHVQLEWAHPVGGRILREFARSNTRGIACFPSILSLPQLGSSRPRKILVRGHTSQAKLGNLAV